MELPLALETALKALLSQHSISSWKISGERENLAVILRLRPETQQSERHSHSGVRFDTVSYKRKPPCQINRDRRRADEFRHRREYIETTAVVEQREAAQREKTIEHELNTESPSENRNINGDSNGEDSQECVTGTAVRAARDSETAETATLNYDSGDHGNEMDTESDSDTESSESETESDQAIQESAREIVRNAKFLNMYNVPENLRQTDRNKTFIKVVCDRRCREAPRLLCLTDDLYAACDMNTGKTNFELRNPEMGDPSFWHYWPHIDQQEVYKEQLGKIRTEMNKVLSRIREMKTD